MLESLFIKGSVFLIVGSLVAGGLGAPISEDIVLLTVGALSGRELMLWPVAFAACFFGVLLADTITYLVARKMGNRAFETKLFKRVLSDERRAKAEGIFERWGAGAIFFSRFLIGFRIPSFAMAGAMKMPAWKFIACDAAGLAITCPTVFFVGYFFAHRLAEIQQGFEVAGTWIATSILAAIALVAISVLFLQLYRRVRPAPVVDVRRTDSGIPL